MSILESLRWPPKPVSFEPERIPPSWKIRSLILEIVELPENVYGRMLVKVLWRESDAPQERSDTIWSMVMTPLIARCLVKAISDHGLENPTKLHGARLTIRRRGSRGLRNHLELSVELPSIPTEATP